MDTLLTHLFQFFYFKGGSSAAAKGGSKAGETSKAGSSKAGDASKAGATPKAGAAAKSSAKTGAKSGASNTATNAPPPPPLGFDPGNTPVDRGQQSEIKGSFPSLDGMMGLAGMGMGGSEQKGGKSIYSYYRSDMDRSSAFYVPPSLRHRWKYHRPSRFEVGAPLPQDGFKPSGSEGGSDAAAGSEGGGSPHTLQGMPLDYFPNPLDPPMYKTTTMDDGVIGGDGE